MYDQMGRHNADRMVVLTAEETPWGPSTAAERAAHDETCGYPIHRIRQLRPIAGGSQTTAAPPTRLQRLASFADQDLRIMIAVLRTVRRLIRRYGVQTVVIGELISLGWLVWPLRLLFGTRVVLYCHGEEITQDVSGTAARLRGPVLRAADGIVAVSRFCKSEIVSRYGVEPHRIRVVVNGVDTDAFHPRPPDERAAALPEAAIKASQGGKVVLAVSRMVPRKGVDTLLTAFETVHAAEPDACLLIVGGGPQAEELRARAAGLRCAGAVHFLGKVEQERLLALYGACDIFALPCRTLPDGDTEGFGLVFLEANACGVPVVGGAAGGTVEAVVDGETGLLVDGWDADDVARALLTLLGDPALAQRMGRIGLARARDHAWSTQAARFVDACAPAATAREPAFAPNGFAFEDGGPPRLLMTVDLEETFDWSHVPLGPHSTEGAREMARFHERCGDLGVRPVYLASLPMVQDPEVAAFLRAVIADGSGEVGLHLHGWVTPPYWEFRNVFNSFQCNLPRHIMARKLETMVDAFAQTLDSRPTIHRAGRWGGDAATMTVLEEMGIRVDLSASSGFRFTTQGGPDFTNLDVRPFWGGSEGRVLCVPASGIPMLRGPDTLSRAAYRLLERRGPAALRRAPGRLWSPVRFSPEGNSLGRMRVAAEVLSRLQAPVAVCTVHSTSLVAGANPYARDAAAARAMLGDGVALLQMCLGEFGMRPTTCADLYDAATARATAPARPRADAATAPAAGLRLGASDA